LVLVLKRVVPTFPGSLLAVVLAGVASITLDLPERGVAVVGDIAAGLPSLTVPQLPLRDVSLLTLPAAGLALVAFADTMANAQTYAKRHGYEVSANRELAALGAANIASGFSRALAISEAITYIDTTGIDTLRELRAELAAAGIRLTIARDKVMLRGVLDSAGLTAEIGPDCFFPTVRTGVRAYRERADT
jgi:MFS superfamily sulfate permease-like transporter